mmetsp:Transcript_50164/g.107969  ORF Transcript_50164/g.107969 Transcript_50164/m.107969 type:complete len:81 (+) Transcript_50164:492-734(+)
MGTFRTKQQEKAKKQKKKQEEEKEENEEKKERTEQNIRPPWLWLRRLGTKRGRASQAAVGAGTAAASASSMCSKMLPLEI